MKLDELRRVRILELRVTRKRDWFWGADVFLGPVPLIKLHFALTIAILVGVWR